ncbi:MAG: alpha/beta hydrolase [Bacteroidota bacterium]
MKKQILFAHSAGKQDGPGQGSYDLVVYLRKALGEDYEVLFPLIENPEAPTYEMFKTLFKHQFDAITEPVILIGHSLGGSMLLKYLSEETIDIEIAGVFLIAIPQWSSDGWDVASFALKKDFETTLPALGSVFFYQGTRDPVVPLAHLNFYKAHLKNAVFRELEVGDHAFQNGLPELVGDLLRVS